MGGARAGARSFNPLILFFSVLFSLFLIYPSINAADATDSKETPPPNLLNGGVGDIATTKTNASPPSQPPLPVPPPPISSWNYNEKPKSSPVRPSIAVIVAVMTTVFSITFLLLLYARHCKSGNAVVVAGFNGNPPNLRGGLASHARKNSGIDRAVIESLPIFRFGSLRGEKDGLECAVCLTKFEPTEVLRLLPKCEHAFHVECVDTWLDAHSTCPLCRYRVDPEDILLVENVKILHQNLPIIPPSQENSDVDFVAIESGRIGSEFRRVSGRHSSAGEKGRPSESDRESGYYYPTTSFRRSMDSATWRKKSESIAVGCFDRPRKDRILLTEDRTSLERRYEHRIIVSPRSSGLHQRWSDVQSCDLLYLTAEMIITDSRRFISESRSKPSVSRQQQENMQVPLHWNNRCGGHHVSNNISTSCKDEDRSVAGEGGRSVINSRSVSEITGLSRFSNRGSNNNRYRQQEDEHQQRHAGVVSRWLAWISSQSRPSVR